MVTEEVPMVLFVYKILCLKLPYILSSFIEDLKEIRLLLSLISMILFHNS